jgi:hypothetical protein
MGSPFTKKVTPVGSLITGRQLDFLGTLHRQLCALEELDEGAALVRMDRLELQARDLTSEEASAEIYAAMLAVERQRAINAALQAADDTDWQGFWELPDGRIVKVQLAVHGSGRPYGKVLNVETGSFTYDAAIFAVVKKNGARLTLDRAKDLGRLYGLTSDSSTAA